MGEISSDRQILTRQMFRLLPVQIFLAAIGAVNGIVSSFFASNYVGVDAMTAVGIYGPVNIIVTTASAILVSGASILCGEYMGRNEQDRIHNVFTVSLVLSVAVGALFTAIYIVMGAFDLTGFLARDEAVRALFNPYLLGQSAGLIPFMLGSQLTMFLSIENRPRWSFAASIAYIAANLLLNILFVMILGWEAVGLALASGLGMWVFLAVQAVFYLTGRSGMQLRLSRIEWDDALRTVGIGFPGSSTYAYQALRGFIVNALLQSYVGGVGIAAFNAANNVMAVFWSVNSGMIAVSRMLIGVSVGEEDRQTLTDIMRVMFRRFVPVMCAVSLFIMICAVPFTRIFFRDPSEPVYMMTVWGLRLLPLCMPFAVVCVHFTCYGQASGKNLFVHFMSLIDGVVNVSVFTALLIGILGMNAVYSANILNGAVDVLVIIAYAWIRNRKFPSNMDELMVIPADFGVPPEQRMDITVRNMDEVIRISQAVQEFCLERGIDGRRAYLAGLATEEMAGNIVDHGFTKDNRKHTIDIRVAYKEEEVMLRLKDDCVPFDPWTRAELADESDPAKNIGIRMIYRILKDIRYQNILGLNVLMIRI